MNNQQDEEPTYSRPALSKKDSAFDATIRAWRIEYPGTYLHRILEAGERTGIARFAADKWCSPLDEEERERLARLGWKFAHAFSVIELAYRFAEVATLEDFQRWVTDGTIPVVWGRRLDPGFCAALTEADIRAYLEMEYQARIHQNPEMVVTYKLKARGWTQGYIDRFLPKADKTVQGDYCTYRLYLMERVLAVENRYPKIFRRARKPRKATRRPRHKTRIQPNKGEPKPACAAPGQAQEPVAPT
jgi:hypothetical protein